VTKQHIWLLRLRSLLTNGVCACGSHASSDKNPENPENPEKSALSRITFCVDAQSLPKLDIRKAEECGNSDLFSPMIENE
jgi:hypothetical protein